jgi:hypothetical protein
VIKPEPAEIAAHRKSVDHGVEPTAHLCVAPPRWPPSRLRLPCNYVQPFLHNSEQAQGHISRQRRRDVLVREFDFHLAFRKFISKCFQGGHQTEKPQPVWMQAVREITMPAITRTRALSIGPSSYTGRRSACLLRVARGDAQSVDRASCKGR